MIFNKTLAAISLGLSLLGLLPIIAAQVKSPSTLDANVLWSEIEPVLMQISGLINHQIPLDLAQKITTSAVNEIKTYVHPK